MDHQPTHTLIQLSDPHIVPPGALLYGSVDTAAGLARAVAGISRSEVAVAAVILSGDLTDAAEVTAYERLRGIVAPIGAPVLYAMGNHDARGPMRAGLLGAEASDAPVDYVHWAGELRIIVLDSTVPGRPYGELAPSQLDRLAAELAVPAPAGTVLVLHHPPVPSPSAVLNLLLLREPERLAAIVAGSDVLMVLTGHTHHASAGSFGGVPLWVSGSVAYGADPAAPAGRYEGRVGGQYTRVDIYPGGAVATAVPIDLGEVVNEMTVEDMRRYLAE
jgi:3',5'-cyclic-AMP phosphodiesterase